MSLNPGTRLGIYEVTAKIGEGGMGEVYQARDTTLDRDVALKVLPEAFTADPDRLARFQREAKVLASLNHPNIGAIYGLEAAGDTQALVLELIEGPTLADRIAEGPIPVDEALTIATQIADALEAAHEQGIVHRDLKPANVKVRPDGTVKVLDFGLAKAATPEASGTSGSESPTMSLTAATQMGMVIGTAAYMAPEQAKGKPVDKRADIWAFGVVLLEMLVGKRVFEGETASETLAAVMMKEPDWGRLPTDLPPKLDNLVRRCLEKDPRERVRDVGDVRLAMKGAFETTVSAPGETITVAPRQLWQRPVPALGGVLLAVLIAGLAVWTFTRPAIVPADLMRFAITTSIADPPSFAGLNQDVAISPDGKQIIYMGASGGTHLNLRPIDQVIGAPLRGTEGGSTPFVSPDGEWVAFQATTVLKKVSMFGGPPVTLCEAPGRIFGGSWGQDDQIIFGSTGGGLFRVSGGGGEPEPLTTVDASEGVSGHLWPFIIPDRRAVLFVIAKGTPLTSGQLAVLELETGEITELGLAGVSPHYVSTGHVVYAAEDGSVRAVPFDVTALEVTGNPVPLIEGIVVKITGAANFDISNNGSLVYARGSAGGTSERTLVWVDREGREEPAVTEARAYQEFSLAPEGTRVAVRIAGSGTSVWIFDLIRNTNTRLTFDGDPSIFPTWTADGERVAFGAPLYWKAADGTGGPELLSDAGNVFPQVFSPDENVLIVQRGVGDGTDLGTLPLDGDGTVTWLLQEGFGERNAALSPDGHWIAYESNETGQYEVYVRPFPNVDSGRWEVSSAGGIMPLWSPGGGELFFRSGEGLMALSFETDPTFRPGVVTRLFEMTPYFTDLANRRMAVAPDGQRFLLLKEATGRIEADETSGSQITVVLNWFQELTARVPVP